MSTEEAPLRRFKAEDSSSYDSVTEDFDRFSAQFSTPVAGRLVSLAALHGTERILDIGTGTGIVAFHAAKILAGPGRVTAVDLSEGMLAAARSKARREGLSDRIEFLRMDAEKLELPDHSVDVVLSLYALRHFPRPDVALAEMFRVLRPNGRLVLAVGSGPPRFSLDGIKAGLRRGLDLIQSARGRQLMACDFLDTLVRKSLSKPHGLQDDCWADHNRHMTRPLATLIHAAGFDCVRREWSGRRWIVDSPEEFWRLQATFSSFARKRLAVVPTTDLEGLRRQFFDACKRVQARRGNLIYPTGALFFCAHRA